MFIVCVRLFLLPENSICHSLFLLFSILKLSVHSSVSVKTRWLLLVRTHSSPGRHKILSYDNTSKRCDM